MRNFAHIREIDQHQVLAYTESSNDGSFLFIIFRLENGTNIQMKMGFSGNEAKMNTALDNFIVGESDEVLIAQIRKFEKDIVVETDA